MIADYTPARGGRRAAGCEDCADFAGQPERRAKVRPAIRGMRRGTTYISHMSPQKVPAILVVDEHLIVGEVQTRGQRLLDVLNDHFTDWLRVYDVHLARREAKTNSVESMPEAAIRKAELKLALLGGGKHESPEKRRFSFVDKRLHFAVALVGGYEVRGRLHLKGSSDLDRVLAEMSNFIPLTEATVAHAGMAGEKLDASVVLINKAAISMFHVGDCLPSKPAPQPPSEDELASNLAR